MASKWGGKTFMSWAFSGFKTMAHHPARWHTAGVVGKTTAANMVLVGGAFEAGNFTGSIITDGINRMLRLYDD